MRIIEGKSGKINKVNEIISEYKQNNHKILFINATGFMLSYDYEDMDELTCNSTNSMWEEFNDNTKFLELVSEIKSHNYDLIIFYSNDEPANLDNYAFIEDTLGIPCLITIQNNELDELNDYQI